MNQSVASLPSLLSHWKSRQQAPTEQRRRRELEGAGHLRKRGGNGTISCAHQETGGIHSLEKQLKLIEPSLGLAESDSTFNFFSGDTSELLSSASSVELL